MKNRMFLMGVVGLLALSFMVPQTTFAYTKAQQEAAVAYQPRTTAEMIAYLYGRISQLMEMKQALQTNTSGTPTVSLVKFIDIQTQKASDVEATTAVLRGEVLLHGGQTAKVWFEYGENEHFLDLKTRQVSVKSVYDRAQRANVSKLKEDKRYYFRIVAQDKNGVVQYGDVYQFRTDEGDEDE